MPLDISAFDLSRTSSATEADWRAAVDKVLKGGSFDKLRTSTPNGYTIEPLYPADRGAMPIIGHRGANPWTVVERLDHPQQQVANELALAALNGGATGLELVLASSPHARGAGLTLENTTDLADLLDGVLLDLIDLRIDGGNAGPRLANELVDLAIERGLTPDKLNLTVVYDPIGLAARAGRSDVPLSRYLTDSSVISTKATRVFTADGRIYHEAGASRSETLAAVLATAVAYWRALEAAGFSTEEAAGRIGFTLAIDQDQFSAMAEIRALRLLWAQATAAAGIPAATAHIHAETSLRMMSRLDANTNMIRTTIAAFAAGTGGADSLTVLPFSAANGLPDAFARRIARNTQLILLEESNLARVCDPAAGSGRIETETRQLAEAAWGIFQEIEAAGGIVSALTSGLLQARIAATAAARSRDIARRKIALTGVSEFPLLTSAPVPVLESTAATPEPIALAHSFTALKSQRFSEPFERLRDTAVTAALSVFLANLGTVADFNVRSAWAGNLFEVGGIAAPSNNGFSSLDALIAAFKSSGTRAVCIASSDAVYASEALAAVTALKAAGAAPIFLAGRISDPDQEVKLRAAGVDVFLHAGQDVIAVLQDAQARILAG
jgi:methylmalonyl-CoA mutase